MAKSRAIDLNCDMGESFGPWVMGNDEAILRFVSSANIACGFHAGDAGTIRRTAAAALELGVAVGAHPSFPDLQGFGRRRMEMTAEEVYDLVLYQVSAVEGIVRSLGGKLHHVKPHGALYNQAAADSDLAGAIAKAVNAGGDDLILYGLAGSKLINESDAAGLRTASEVFADRTYQEDGSLTPRSRADALVTDPAEAARRALKMASEGVIESTSGAEVRIDAETICIHGDGEHAVEFAKSISNSLSESGFEIKAP